MTDDEVKRYVEPFISHMMHLPAAKQRIAELEAQVTRLTHEIQAHKDALAQCRCNAQGATT